MTQGGGGGEGGGDSGKSMSGDLEGEDDRGDDGSDDGGESDDNWDRCPLGCDDFPMEDKMALEWKELEVLTEEIGER